MKKYIKFVLPGIYFRKTRANTLGQITSWYLVYFCPIILFLIENDSNKIINALSCFILVVATNYIYENGYIENDLITTKNENTPSLRLKEEEISWGRLNIKKIFLIRGLVFSILALAIVSLKNFISLELTFISLASIQILYLIYNRTRSYLNLAIIPILSFLRFFTPIIPLLIIELDFTLILNLFIIYPLCKTIEFSKLKRFKLEKISRIIGAIDIFRVKYYLIAILFLLITNYTSNQQWKFPLYSCIFLLIYRLTGIILMKNKKFSSKINRKTKEDYLK